MALQIERIPGGTPHRISLTQFERMIEAGIFTPGDRVELIEGEILDMAPTNFPHEACVARLNRLLTLAVGDNGYVWPQNNSIRIPDLSRPQPDVTLLKWRDDEYGPKSAPPTADDVLLVIEVSDSSLKYDRTRKLALYASAGIPEYWIVNLNGNLVEIHSEPQGSTYQNRFRSGPGETLQVPNDGALSVDSILR